MFNTKSSEKGIAAAIERALGERMRAANELDPNASLPSQWLELIKTIEENGKPDAFGAGADRD